MRSVEKTGIGNAWLVGFGFRPPGDELINHHLTRKLRGLDEAVREIPELNIYWWEPQTLFERYNAMSDFFYCPRNRKNRKTQAGFWKETRKKRPFRGCDGEEIQEDLRVPRGSTTLWEEFPILHAQYHLNRCSNPTIGSESIEPDLITHGGTAVNQAGKDNKSSPQVCDPKHNLTEAEAEAETLTNHGDCSERELPEDGSIITESHQFSFSDPVNYGDYCPDDGVFISELWGLAETQLSRSISDMGDFGVA